VQSKSFSKVVGKKIAILLVKITKMSNVPGYTIGKQSDGIDNDIGFLILGFSAQVPGFRA
jgi:hypothetical protein